MDFKKFASIIRTQFDKMQKSEVFVTDAIPDVLWQLYLDSFPEGTNPLYKERTEHDCNCCKQFIRNIANTVNINNGNVVTVWDIAAETAPYPYNIVSSKLAEAVRTAKVSTIFRKKETSYGAEVSRQWLEDKSIITWNHFSAKLTSKFVSSNAPSLISDANSNAAVFRRGLEELDISAINIVADLIKDNMIYRGEEHKKIVNEFKHLKEKYSKLNSDAARNIFVWENINNFASRFRNTVIGTLVQDITNGVSLEDAVRMFETKVAPTNYKRSKSLITPSMIKDAMKTIQELNLESSLERRFAVMSDISVNNVLFVDNDVKSLMKDSGIAGLLMDEVKPKKPKTDRAVSISVDDFISNIVPKASSISAMVKNSMGNKFMSLTAPVNADSEPLFKWNNGFGWSYNGNITDSIKDKVKRAGGNVDAKMRVSLHWFNYDDLDIHVIEPDGNRIAFNNKCGKLDVDMNVSGTTRDAVENVQWRTTPKDGVYRVIVNNFRKRESIDVGYELQVESNGVVYDYSYAKPVGHDERALDITVKNGVIEAIKPYAGVTGNAVSQDIWGVKTETFIPVNTIVSSPNHWDDNSVGNKHWFFILKDCVNPDETRGFYNEFLKPGLEKHRKVFEILGDKMKCKVTDKQMSGVGFSSTLKEKLIVHVTGRSINQMYEINF